MVESTVDETLNRIRAERDGCDCPSQVLRCIHFDGHDLMLVDWAEVGGYWSRYHVCTAKHCVNLGPDCTSPYQPSDSKAEALAAFAQAEEELLRGDA